MVDNRPGAGATLGSETVARAAPDGYTMVMSNIASHAISPAVYGNRVRYNPVTDFAHVALVVTNPTVWVANPNSGHPHAWPMRWRRRVRRAGSMSRPPVRGPRTT